MGQSGKPNVMYVGGGVVINLDRFILASTRAAEYGLKPERVELVLDGFSPAEPFWVATSILSTEARALFYPTDEAIKVQ